MTRDEAIMLAKAVFVHWSKWTAERQEQAIAEFLPLPKRGGSYLAKDYIQREVKRDKDRMQNLGRVNP